MTATRGAGLRLSASRNPRSPWRHLDFALVAATLALTGIGLLMVYSASQHRLVEAGLDPQMFLKRQAVFMAVGTVLMLAVSVADYRLFRDLAATMYAGTLAVLVIVLSPLGSSSKGAQAWFQLGSFQLEPSEFGKLTLIVAVAAYAASHKGELSARHIGLVLVLAALPCGLVYLQPDLGTALVLVVIIVGILLVAGAKLRHMVALALLGLVAVVAVLQLGVLKQYQLDRLGAFLEPKTDTQRSAYNLNQSKIAIGSGGLTGKGLFNGPQTNLSYVPEQHTDFIFTVVGEELGFVGAAFVLMLYALIMWRVWRTAAMSSDFFGTLVCTGVLSMLVFQVFQNAGMTMGIMPITGIPLPFLSYGGSATVASFLAIGLVLNVHMRRLN